MIKDFYVIWLDPEYPNNGAIMSDIKRKAGEGRLRISSDGAIYKVDCIADWDRRDWDEYEGFLDEDEENEYY